MSSLVFLGFSVIMFLISYGIMFTVTPMILGQFYSVLGNMTIASASWQATYDQTEAITQYIVPLIPTYDETESITRYIVPLIPTVGLFIFIIKVLMVAAVRGRD